MLNAHLENDSIINYNIPLFEKSAPSRFHREAVSVQEPHALDYFCEGLYKERDNFNTVVFTVREELKQRMGERMT